MLTGSLNNAILYQRICFHIFHLFRANRPHFCSMASHDMNAIPNFVSSDFLCLEKTMLGYTSGRASADEADLVCNKVMTSESMERRAIGANRALCTYTAYGVPLNA